MTIYNGIEAKWNYVLKCAQENDSENHCLLYRIVSVTATYKIIHFIKAHNSYLG